MYTYALHCAVSMLHLFLFTHCLYCSLQKERVELQQSFGSWKLRHSDERREAFTVVLARKHHHQRVKGRVWEAWYGLIQSRWKQRVEKACQVSGTQCRSNIHSSFDFTLAYYYRHIIMPRVRMHKRGILQCVCVCVCLYRVLQLLNDK